MKSWLHNITESYIYETPATRRDLKEHYNLLTEEEKFALLSENALKYLDEQLKTAYGFGISDLTEEELGMVLQNLFEIAPVIAGVAKAAGPAVRAVGGAAGRGAIEGVKHGTATVVAGRIKKLGGKVETEETL